MCNDIRRRSVEGHIDRRPPRVHSTDFPKLLGKEPRSRYSGVGATGEINAIIKGDNPNVASSEKTSRGGIRGGNSLVINNDFGSSSTSRGNSRSIMS